MTLSHAKSVTAAFHLHNREAKHQLKVKNNGFAGSGWGAGAKTLRTAALFLIYSTAVYYAPAWCRSAHTRLIDRVLNHALPIVTGCLRPTPTYNLPLLSGIQPAELRRQGAALSLANRSSTHNRSFLSTLLSVASDK